MKRVFRPRFSKKRWGFFHRPMIAGYYLQRICKENPSIVQQGQCGLLQLPSSKFASV